MIDTPFTSSEIPKIVPRLFFSFSPLRRAAPYTPLPFLLWQRRIKKSSPSSFPANEAAIPFPFSKEEGSDY